MWLARIFGSGLGFPMELIFFFTLLLTSSAARHFQSSIFSVTCAGGREGSRRKTQSGTKKIWALCEYNTHSIHGTGIFTNICDSSSKALESYVIDGTITFGFWYSKYGILIWHFMASMFLKQSNCTMGGCNGVCMYIYSQCVRFRS